LTWKALFREESWGTYWEAVCVFEGEVAWVLRAMYEQPITSLVGEVNLRLSSRGQEQVGAEKVEVALTSGSP
jgi:hypothetical protein